MRKKLQYRTLLPIYSILLLGFLIIAIGGSRAVTVLSENAPISNRKVVIIDAGHGGIDGGATSCTGVLESQINLEISKKLNDLLHLIGIDTVMIRTGDYSIHTKEGSISQIKISDLKERVRIINSTENAILLSIHQNYFSDSKYSGAQTFYAPTSGSKELATSIQETLKLLDNTNNRQIKKADGIYLMQHIACPGVLIECGFLSNTVEEALLRNADYQNKLCSIIASACSLYLH